MWWELNGTGRASHLMMHFVLEVWKLQFLFEEGYDSLPFEKRRRNHPHFKKTSLWDSYVHISCLLVTVGSTAGSDMAEPP